MLATSADKSNGDLAAVLAELADLRSRVERLEAKRGPRDRVDAQLVLAIFHAAAGLPFRAGDVFTRAEAVPELREALRGADVDNEKQLGILLARMHGADVEGVRVVRYRRRLWRVVRVE